MVFGRVNELRRIANEISKEEFSFTLIYGRYRVGKSELVKQAINESNLKSIYYECKQVSEASNTNSLSNIVSDVFNLPKLGYSSINDLLEYVFELSIKESFIFVLDEYPYMKENVKGLDSILQTLIDKYQKTSKMKMFILGSYVDVMKSLLEHSNPLYGRVDLTINLQQMDYYESSLFYPNFSNEDKVRIYSVFGGIPYYNRLVNDRKSVKENIIDLIASSQARLENEVSMYLNAEISKIVNANEVFDALAKGFTKYSDLLSQSHVSSGPTLIDVLGKLIRMEVVEKISQINDESNRKKSGYVISDNLCSFYYRYIFRYSSQLKIMDSNVFYKKYIEKDFEEQFVPHQFEAICKQYLIRKNKLGEINPVIEKLGKYYYDNPKEHTNGEFDIVSQDENGYVFYEVKFQKNPLSKEQMLHEIEQVKATGLNCYKYVFISRSGFEEITNDSIELIELKQLYM